jgi:hypothetical protein
MTGRWIMAFVDTLVGCQFCHARYLVIKGKHVTMFKRNPIDYPQAVSLDHLHQQTMLCGLDVLLTIHKMLLSNNLQSIIFEDSNTRCRDV